MNILLDLFLTFAKIGFFTFGGGFAMISMIENVCVEKKQWITHDEMMNVTSPPPAPSPSTAPPSQGTKRPGSSAPSWPLWV